MVMMYIFDLNTGEYLGEREAQAPNGTPITESLTATPLAPPVTIPAGHVARWTDTAWEIVEDHRQKMNEQGSKIGGTPYWPTGATANDEATYMTDLGPLPGGVAFTRPERSLEDCKEDVRRSIAAGHDAALVATLTMPAASPGAAAIATEAALFAVEDAAGLADVRAILAARRATLETAVDVARSRAELNEIVVVYPV